VGGRGELPSQNIHWQLPPPPKEREKEEKRERRERERGKETRADILFGAAIHVISNLLVKLFPSVNGGGGTRYVKLPHPLPLQKILPE
jgi:hypothetical protein